MIGVLPESLEINGKEYLIETDYRVALIILEACNDEELTDQDKALAVLSILYSDFEEMDPDDYEEALKKASWYLDGGKTYSSENKKPVISWEQDEQMIFSAINKVAGREVRAESYMHWWTFLGFFNEIGEGIFSTVVSIRSKLNKGKKLDKVDEEFYKENRDLVIIRKKKTTEQEEKEKELEERLGIQFS